MPASIGSLSELSILYELHDSCSPSYLSLWNILQTGWLTCVIVTLLVRILAGCSFTGSIPQELGNLKQLTFLWVLLACIFGWNIHFISRSLHSTYKFNCFCHAFTLERWTRTSLRAKFRLHSVYSRTSTGSIWLITSSLDQYRSQRQPRQDLTFLPTHSTCKWCQSYFLHL